MDIAHIIDSHLWFDQFGDKANKMHFDWSRSSRLRCSQENTCVGDYIKMGL